MRVTRLFSATLTICAAVFAAAVSVNAAEPAGPSPYEDVLTRARNFCGDGAGTAEDGNDEGMTGIIEAAGKLTPAECLERTGYAVRDINGDGTPECLIGKIDGGNGVSRTGKQLYAVFALRDGSPAPVMEGTFRNRIFLLDDGSLFREGYAGVMAFIFGVYRLPRGQSRTECLEFFFTHAENESSRETGYYRNASEGLDPATAEAITQQAFEMKEKALATRVASLSLIPLAAFQPASSAQNGMPVRATRAESVTPGNGAYDTFIADASESRVWDSLFRFRSREGLPVPAGEPRGGQWRKPDVFREGDAQASRTRTGTASGGQHDILRQPALVRHLLYGRERADQMFYRGPER